MSSQIPRRETAGGFFRTEGMKPFVAIHLTPHAKQLAEFARLERHAFAAKIRLARAVLGWSQTDLGRRIGLTQRAIHKLEQGETEPRRTTARALEDIWREQNIEFEDLADGGFRATIRSSVYGRPAQPRRRGRPGYGPRERGHDGRS
jgi:DNA-binding XRE family transcriptional regulator